MTWEDSLVLNDEPEETPIYHQLVIEQRAAFWARLGFKEVKDK